MNRSRENLPVTISADWQCQLYPLRSTCESHVAAQLSRTLSGYAMSQVITDIWFRTSESLETVADHLGLVKPIFDAENYWAWVIGGFGDVQIDITRTHTIPADTTDTRIFRCDNLEFSESQAREISNAIIDKSLSDVSWGQWRYIRGNDFEKLEHDRLSEPD